MAGMFYSLREAAEKLNISEDQLKELAQEGKLREFRDGPNLLFKVDEVEAFLTLIKVFTRWLQSAGVSLVTIVWA